VFDELSPSTPEAAPPVEAVTEPPAQRTNLLREIIETVLLTAIIFLLVNTATGRYRIEGNSMEPNLHNDEYVLIDKISYLLHPPERGDIIVFTPPNNDRDYIKRVIGLPGDTVEVRGGQVYVNGVPLDEPYLAQATNQSMDPLEVPPDRYFVMGDNRNNSSDSRSFGPITAQVIVGRALFVYWPPTDWGAVPHYTYAALKSN
jgi:signal peptidase I